MERGSVLSDAAVPTGLTFPHEGVLLSFLERRLCILGRSVCCCVCCYAAAHAAATTAPPKRKARALAVGTGAGTLLLLHYSVPLRGWVGLWEFPEQVPTGFPEELV